MIYRNYGETGKRISVIGFGGMRFKKADSIEKGAEIVRKASELGVNYFDTAPTYCAERSEIIFGEAFRAMPNRFYVATKFMPTIKARARHLRRSLETSLKRMGLEKIDFYHMWCIRTYDDYKNAIKKGGPYKGAVRAKEEGLIGHIAFSAHCDSNDIIKIINDNLFEGVLLGYNVLNYPYREKAMKVAYEKGLGVTIMNPLGGGVIPQNPKIFGFIRENQDETIAQAALRFVVSQKEVTSALTAMTTMEEVVENVKAGETVAEIPPERMEEIKKNLSAGLNGLCTGCKYCEECPADIKISGYMLTYNEKIISNRTDEEMKKEVHYNREWSFLAGSTARATDCTECGRCEQLCTQKLPIIERLKYIAERWEE